MTDRQIAIEEMSEGLAYAQRKTVKDVVVHCMRSMEEILAIAADIQRYHEATGTVTPNNVPARYLSTVVLLGHQPHVAIARRGTEIVGVVMAREARRRERLRFGYSTLPSPNLRSLDVIYGGFHAVDAPAAEALLHHLASIMRQRRCDLLTLNHVDTRRDDIDALTKILRPASSARQKEIDTHIEYEIVNGGYKKNLSHLSSKHRYNLRRERRLLAERFEGGLTLRVFRDLQDVDELARGTHQLAVKTWQARSRGNFLDTPLTRALLEDDAKAGSLRSYWLLGAGRLIAFQIGGIYGGRYVLHNIGHDPAYERMSPGKTLFQMALEDLCQSGAQFIDYGFGDAAYKQQFATDQWDEQRWCCYSKSCRGRYVGFISRRVGDVSKVATNILSRAGMIERVKRKWRSRLSSKQ